MGNYCVNKNAQPTGEHEVHKIGCSYLPLIENRIPLGDCSNCQGAVKKARTIYSIVDGCKYCCNACHTR
ncbi:MAG: hypothetical protein RPU64_04830 [Candidatus Sedimenticola sp. (ex Thyasira tokunagai)]